MYYVIFKLQIQFVNELIINECVTTTYFVVWASCSFLARSFAS